MIYNFLLGEKVSETAETAIEKNLDNINTKVDKISKLGDTIVDKLVDFGFSILVAAVILIIGRVILSIVRKAVKRLLDRSRIDVAATKFIDSLVKIAGYAVIIITICAQIGIQTTSLVALLGTAGLSIGLALQGSLSNFAGGVLILFSKPFVAGDYIEVKDCGEGYVKKIDMIYTTLTTDDRKTIQIPNGKVADSTITTMSFDAARRVVSYISISYTQDIDKAKKVAQKVIDECPFIIEDVSNNVVVKELKDSSVLLAARLWADKEKYYEALYYLNENLKKAFDENDITIPYNKLDVNIINK